MTLENFNLQITTPEDDNNTDPEFIRLHDALMALKQPLLDAIADKDLPKAEELHKQALEAKAKLEAYKESLNKKEEYKTIEINGVKVELGPELGKMTWDEIPAKLEEFNKTLKPREKPWRVPVPEEFMKIGKPIREISENTSLSDDQKIEKSKELVMYLGFAWGSYYWSNDEYIGHRDCAWRWNANNGHLYEGGKDMKRLVRLIR